METDIGIFIYFMKQLVGTPAFPLSIHFFFTILRHLDPYLRVILSVNFQKSVFYVFTFYKIYERL